MNIGCHWYFQVTPDGRKNLAAFAYADPAKRSHRSPICLVVRGLENEINICGRADFGDLLRHARDKLLRLNHARPENEGRTFAADHDVADFERLDFHRPRSLSRSGGMRSIALTSALPAPEVAVLHLTRHSFGRLARERR